MGIVVRRIEAHQVDVLRATRLAALADSPAAFASTFERESGFTDALWADRARASASGDGHSTFIAWDEDEAVGMVTGVRTDSGAVDLVSMWTAPVARRRGLGRRLVDAVVDWAAAIDADSVRLWVTRDNEPALELYGAHGFSVTTVDRPLPSDPCKDEVRMIRLLR